MNKTELKTVIDEFIKLSNDTQAARDGFTYTLVYCPSDSTMWTDSNYGGDWEEYHDKSIKQFSLAKIISFTKIGECINLDYFKNEFFVTNYEKLINFIKNF